MVNPGNPRGPLPPKRRGRPENPSLVQSWRGWRARVWVQLPNGERDRRTFYFSLDKKVAEVELRRLLKRSEAERLDAIEDPAGSVTFRDLAERWTSGELHRLYPDHVSLKERSVADDRLRLAKLFPSIGHVPLVSFRLEDAERAMANLPATAKSAASRRHYAQLITRVLRLAEYPCKIIDRSPLPRGFLPKVARTKAHQWLWPDEEARLLGCTDVPLDRRVLYGLLAREGMRLSEALGLTWGKIDLERGVIHLDQNKTDDPRTWMLSADVVTVLRVFRAGASADATVFQRGPLRKAATVFRRDLRTAGVTRAELFERTSARAPIRVHDLRATFITLALANGRTESWVADRTGHRDSTMINRYRRAARTASELNLGTLHSMHLALVVHGDGTSTATGAPAGAGNSGTGEPQFASDDSALFDEAAE
jgi:integrase